MHNRSFSHKVIHLLHQCTYGTSTWKLLRDKISHIFLDSTIVLNDNQLQSLIQIRINTAFKRNCILLLKTIVSKQHSMRNYVAATSLSKLEWTFKFNLQSTEQIFTYLKYSEFQIRIFYTINSSYYVLKY